MFEIFQKYPIIKCHAFDNDIQIYSSISTLYVLVLSILPLDSVTKDYKTKPQYSNIDPRYGHNLINNQFLAIVKSYSYYSNSVANLGIIFDKNLRSAQQVNNSTEFAKSDFLSILILVKR